MYIFLLFNKFIIVYIYLYIYMCVFQVFVYVDCLVMTVVFEVKGYALRPQMDPTN